MKKVITLFIIIVFSFIIIGCSSSSSIKELNDKKIEILKNKVQFFNYALLEKGISEQELKEGWEEQSDMFTLKGNNVFYYEKEIKGVDVKTFIPLLNGYSLDKNNVYFGDKKLNIPVKDFHFVSGTVTYITDGKNIYWGDKRLTGIDIKSFIGMGFENTINLMGYAKDKNNYYLEGKILTGEKLENYLNTQK